VAIAAYLGFLLTAINLLPFKRFDGGNVVHAMYGVRGSVIIGQVVKALLLVLGFLQLNFTGHNGALLFALLLSFFPTVSDPTLNDVSEINSGRDILGLGLLAIAVLVFLPVGGGMASWLGV
jgi:membrane-associated protease RseP (regulator of RpoE activity)